MLEKMIPKLPMRNKAVTKEFYLSQLSFIDIGSANFDGYLLMQKDAVEIHFFEFRELDPNENYGQVYIRTNDIDSLYQSLLDNKINIHPAGQLEIKPWGQKEFAILDPDNNLITFGQKA
jgi:hypothetical protein